MHVKRIALATVPALLLAGIVTVATVGASAPATAQDDTIITNDDSVADGITDGRPDHDGIRHHFAGRAGLDVVADVLGMTEDDLKAELQGGKTIAEVAVEQGSSAQAVIDALVAEASARIDEAVAAGDITAEEAATMLDSATARITDMVNEATFVRPPDPIDTVAGLLGLTSGEVRAALRDGSTIADLAAENGVDLDTVVDTLTDEARARIEAWVNGEGGAFGFGGRGGPGHGRGHGHGLPGGFGGDDVIDADEALLDA